MKNTPRTGDAAGLQDCTALRRDTTEDDSTLSAVPIYRIYSHPEDIEYVTRVTVKKGEYSETRDVDMSAPRAEVFRVN